MSPQQRVPTLVNGDPASIKKYLIEMDKLNRKINSVESSFLEIGTRNLALKKDKSLFKSAKADIIKARQKIAYLIRRLDKFSEKIGIS